MTAIASPAPALPYNPVLARLLRPIQRAFLAVNRLLVARALRIGLGRAIGNPLTGRLMLLRTRGRVTGRVREVPLGYVIQEGAVWCVAGYGRTTPWYRNLVADPAVEVVLSGRTFRGRATPVEDGVAWAAAYRRLIRSFGLLGRAVLGPIDRLSDEELITRHGALPVVRIEAVDPPGPIVAGAWDRGPLGWVVVGGWVALVGTAMTALACALRDRPNVASQPPRASPAARPRWLRRC